MSPPEDKGCLGPDPAEPEADEGRGFLLTGEAVLILEFCAWKEEKEGTLMVVGFDRAGIGVVAAVETEGAPFWCEDRPRSILSPGVTEWYG